MIQENNMTDERIIQFLKSQITNYKKFKEDYYAHSSNYKYYQGRIKTFEIILGRFEGLKNDLLLCHKEKT